MKKLAVFFPGLGGSQLDQSFPVLGKVPYWIDFGKLFLLGPGPLTLADDGVSPQPGIGSTLDAGGVVLNYYTGLFRLLQENDYTTQVMGFDWRKSLLDPIQFLAGSMETAAIGFDSITAIGHSQGGLVARLLWGACSPEVRSKWTHTIYLGTPFGGSYTPAAAFMKAGPFFSQAVAIANLRRGILTGGICAVFDAVTRYDQIYSIMVTWPGLYELLPFTKGPYATIDPHAPSLFIQATYGPGIVLPEQKWLDAAENTQTQLVNLAAHPPRETVVISTGIETVDQWNDITHVLSTTDQGDGTVPAERATFPGATRTVNLLNVSHSELPDSQEFLDELPDLLSNPGAPSKTVPLALTPQVGFISLTPNPVNMSTIPFPATFRPNSEITRGDP
jgi:hypothetical protein